MPTTATKSRPQTKTTLPTTNAKNAGWSLSNVADIKKTLAPLEYVGLEFIVNKLLAGGVKFMPLYRGQTANGRNWTLANEAEMIKHISAFELGGLKNLLDNLSVRGLQFKIVYKNIAMQKEVV
jgi:hypothetical protein